MILWDASQWKTPVKPKTETVSDAEAKAPRARFLATAAKELGIRPLSTPALVRYIFPEDLGVVWSKCLADAGWPNATAGPDGTIEIQNPPKAQQTAFNTAYYHCQAQYTIDPRMLVGAPPAT